MLCSPLKTTADIVMKVTGTVGGGVSISAFHQSLKYKCVLVCCVCSLMLDFWSACLAVFFLILSFLIL